MTRPDSSASRVRADAAEVSAPAPFGPPGRAAAPPAVPGRAVRREALVGDLTPRAVFATDNPRVAPSISDGFVTPVGNGLATLTAKVGGRSPRASISVEDLDSDEPWSFRNHVQPILTKQGCNSGACHGAAAGKNGFRLTLRGYGPEIDYDVLTRQALGRRIVKTAPGREPDPAQADRRDRARRRGQFAPDSLEYRVIAEWIAAGMPRPVRRRARDRRACSLSPTPSGSSPGSRSRSWSRRPIPTAGSRT